MAKSNFKWIAVIVMVFLMAAAVTGCGNSGNGEAERDSGARVSEQSAVMTEDDGQNANASSENDKSQTEESLENENILVAYFSYSGNTKKIAEEIQNKTGADIFEIRTVNTYSADYDTVLDEAKEELDENARPELSGQIENIEQYETVIIGYPIWWGDMPMAVYSFLDEYDLSGKTILPFCTHGGSGLSGTDANIRSEEEDAKVVEGLAISDSALDDAGEEIDRWLQDNSVTN